MKRRSSFARNVGFLMVAAAGFACQGQAGPIVTIPTGLAPGSQYRLVFVTAESYTATSTSISAYNTDVTTDANNAGLGGTWLAIGSTDSENAIANIGADAGIPIYNLAGQLIASDATANSGGLFSGTLMDPIETDEDGTLLIADVWTGTSATSGDEVSGDGLGDSEVVYGYSPLTSDIAIEDTLAGASKDKSLYAISEILTVPGTATPEPPTTFMALTGALMLFAAGWNRKGRPRFHR
jgi:hypothetical protein